MDVSFHPLLTSQGLPAADGSGSSVVEICLVREYLQSLPSTLRAHDGYKLLADYYNKTLSRRVNARQELYIIERLLLWCFSIKKKSISALMGKDISKFIDFLRAPPEKWLGKVGIKRFIVERGVSKPNPKWRPCSAPILDPERVRFTLNKFLRFGSEFMGLVICPPSPQKAGIKQCCCRDAEKLALVYMEALATYRPGRAASERGLFLFATSLYLRISHSELAKYCNEFSMQCFVVTAYDSGLFRLATNTGVLERELPSGYMKFFFRWREYLGLSKYPQFTEQLPIFTRRALVNFTCELPDICPGGYSPTQILKSLFLRCPNCNKKVEVRQAASVQASARFRKRVSDKQLTHRAIHGVFLLSKSNCSTLGIAPIPLFGMSSRSFKPLSATLRVNMLVGGNKFLDIDVCRAGVSFFDLLAMLDSSRLKLMAFEKLTLWSMLILKKTPAELFRHEVEQFYVFCMNPPVEWVVQGRAFRDNGLYEDPEFTINQNWRPFYQLPPDKASQVARASRIVGWCNSCFVTLVKAGHLRENPFSDFNKRIN